MEVTCSSETSVEIQWSTRRCMLEDRTLPNHRRENLKPYKFCVAISHILNADLENGRQVITNKRNNLGELTETYVVHEQMYISGSFSEYRREDSGRNEGYIESSGMRAII